jgi:hypothetical protein
MIFEVGVEAFADEIAATLALAEIARGEPTDADLDEAQKRLAFAMAGTGLLRALFKDEPEVLRAMSGEANDRQKTIHDATQYLEGGHV